MKAAPNSKKLRVRYTSPHAEKTATNTLLPRLDIRRDQAHVVYARATHNINRARYIRKLNRVIALHEGRFLRALLEDILQARPQPIPRNFILIDQQISAGRDLHNNRRERFVLIQTLR